MYNLHIVVVVVVIFNSKFWEIIPLVIVSHKVTKNKVYVTLQIYHMYGWWTPYQERIKELLCFSNQIHGLRSKSIEGKKRNIHFKSYPLPCK